LLFRFVVGCGITLGCVQETETQAEGTPEVVSVESVLLLASMHSDLMESAEEAMAYPLLDDATEKEDYYAKVLDLEALSVRFEKVATADQMTAFEGVVDAKVAVLASAETMFEGYEAQGAVNAEEVSVFENDIDLLIVRLDTLLDDSINALSNGTLEDNMHASAAVYLVRMDKDAMEAVEEAMAYLLLNDEEEKQNFYINMQDFDASAASVEALEYLDREGSEDTSALYHNMTQSKETLYAEAETLFASYEAQGAVTKDEMVRFEDAVDAYAQSYEQLFAHTELMRAES